MEHFVKWASKIIGKKTDRKGLPLRVLFFEDGEPYIGTYPSITYSLYLYNLTPTQSNGDNTKE